MQTLKQIIGSVAILIAITITSGCNKQIIKDEVNETKPIVKPKKTRTVYTYKFQGKWYENSTGPYGKCRNNGNCYVIIIVKDTEYSITGSPEGDCTIESYNNPMQLEIFNENDTIRHQVNLLNQQLLSNGDREIDFQ